MHQLIFSNIIDIKQKVKLKKIYNLKHKKMKIQQLMKNYINYKMQIFKNKADNKFIIQLIYNILFTLNKNN